MLDSIQPPKKYKRFVPNPKTKKRIKWAIFVVAILILIIPVFYIFKTGMAFSKIMTIKNISWEKIFGNKMPGSEYTPTKDEDRINFLLLGIRGEGDPNGGMLSDGIMLISLKKSTGQVALISIPRDLYLQMPGEVSYAKINEAYEVGTNKYDNGLDYVKKTIAYVTGQYIDYSAVINFDAFKDIIDLLGGVTVHLDSRFVEDKQWYCDGAGQNCRPFIVEAGDQTLNGENALMYARSRFSSDDFDRARRQQQIIVALKDKVLSLGILSDPVKVGGIIDVLAKNVKTDVGPWEIPQLLDIAQKAKTDNIIHKVFQNTPEGLLYDTKINKIYVLLPTTGDFSQIRDACANIFNI